MPFFQRGFRLLGVKVFVLLVALYDLLVVPLVIFVYGLVVKPFALAIEPQLVADLNKFVFVVFSLFRRES